MFNFLKKIEKSEWERLSHCDEVDFLPGLLIDHESGNLIAFDYWYDDFHNDYFKLDLPNPYFKNGDD